MRWDVPKRHSQYLPVGKLVAKPGLLSSSSDETQVFKQENFCAVQVVDQVFHFGTCAIRSKFNFLSGSAQPPGNGSRLYLESRFLSVAR